MNTLSRNLAGAPSPNIAVIIPSANHENLATCLAAVQRHEPYLGCITVWSGMHCPFCRSQKISTAESGRYVCTCVNGSKGFGVTRFRQLDMLPSIVMEAPMPFCFAKSVNAGILEAQAISAPEGFLILNDDALLKTPGGFSLLAWAAREHPEYGIIAATTNVVGNENQRPLANSRGLREDPRMVCFVAVYIPKRTIDRLVHFEKMNPDIQQGSPGLLDERLVYYGVDDDDYCLRIRKAGLMVGIHDGCFVDHGSLKSSYLAAPEHQRDFKPNLRIFIEKWGHDNRGLGKDESPWKELWPE